MTWAQCPNMEQFVMWCSPLEVPAKSFCEELLIFPEMATKLSLDLWKEGGGGVENKV